MSTKPGSCHGRPSLEQLPDPVPHVLRRCPLACRAVEVATIPKPTVDPYQVVNFKDLDELYFLYICEKDPKLDKEKDQKKYWERMKKLGKTKKNKKGAKPARMNKRKEAKNLASMNG